MSRSGGRRVALLAGLVLASLAVAGPADLPRIVQVVAPPRLALGERAELTIGFRAPRANVVVLLQVVEDLDGPPAGRATRQRAHGVVARAFGREAGTLSVPLAFGTPGEKRVTLTLVTDDGDEGPPATVEVRVMP